MKLLVCLYLFFILPTCTTLNEKEGRVVGIIDGDTFDVILDGRQTRIRMFGIDAPERHQAYYRQSKETLSSLIFSKKVRVEKKNKDAYKRWVANVYLGDQWINKVMISRGMAWHFKRYSSDATLANAEIEARNKHLGLWSDKAVAPWNYRKSLHSSAVK